MQKPLSFFRDEKNPWLVRLCRGLYILPNDIGIIISQYKDPYKPTRIQWKVISFFFFFRGSFRI